MTSLHNRNTVKVQTNGRLHMGFLDLNGELDRQFGSFGVGLNDIRTALTVSNTPANSDQSLHIEATGNDSERAASYAKTLCQHLDIRANIRININESITPHAGLGSGTQLALSVGKAITTLFDNPLSTAEIAALLGRGRRSSIGISTFDQGGFHIDCGASTGDSTQPPPVFFSMPFPGDWRFVLLFDHEHIGLHGTEESNAFTALAPFSSETASRLCRLTVMKLIPGLIEKNILDVGSTITEIQAYIGDHFAPVQGARFVSPAVTEQLDWFSNRQIAGYGQSSWGPTGFVLCENEQIAVKLCQESAHELADNRCELKIVSAANDSAQITFSTQ